MVRGVANVMADPIAIDVKALRASRIKLLLMFLLPLLAIVLATLVFYTGTGIPRATTNKGVLLIPPRQIDELELSNQAGQRWRHSAAEPGWELLTVGTGDCADPCRARLYLTRQIRLALGKNTDRISRYFLMTDQALDPDFADYLSREHKDLQLLQVDPLALHAWLGQQNDPDPLVQQPIFIIDPAGFAMMYYLPAHTGSDTISDLRFLLEHSREKVR